MMEQVNATRDERLVHSGIRMSKKEFTDLVVSVKENIGR